MGTEEQTNTQMAKVDKRQSESLIIQGPNPIVVHGVEMVSARFIEIVELISKTVAPNDVITIVLHHDKDPLPKNAKEETIHGLYTMATRTVDINTEKHINAVSEALCENKTLTASLRGLYWESMILTVIHEFLHSQKRVEVGDEEFMKIMGTEEHEAEVEKQAREVLDALAKTGHNMEPPAIHEEPRMLEEIDFYRSVLNDSPEEVEDWVKLQVKYADEGIMFEDPNGVPYLTFKALLRSTSDTVEDPTWDTDRAEQDAKQPVLIPENAEAAPAESTAGPEIIAPVETEQPVENAGEEPIDYDEAVSMMSTEDLIMDMAGQMEGGGIDMGEALVETVIPNIPHNNNSGVAVPPPPPNTTNVTADTSVDNGVYVPPAVTIPSPNAVAQGAGAVATPVPPQATLTPLTLDRLTQRTAIQTVAGLLFNHLVGKCEFDNTAPTGYRNPQAVRDYGINISNIPHALEIFLGYDDGSRNPVMVPANTGIRGYITPKQGLPAYSLWINKGGVPTQMKFIVQNPNKTNQNGLTTYASKVRNQGCAVAWLMEERPMGQRSVMVLLVEQAPGQHLRHEWVIDTFNQQ